MRGCKEPAAIHLSAAAEARKQQLHRQASAARNGCCAPPPPALRNQPTVTPARWPRKDAWGTSICQNTSSAQG